MSIFNFKVSVYTNIKMLIILWLLCHSQNAQEHFSDLWWFKDCSLWSGAAGLSAGATAVVASVGGAAGAVIGGAADLFSRSKKPPSNDDDDDDDDNDDGFEEGEETEMNLLETKELMPK